MDNMSRSSLPNLDYQPSNRPTSPLMGHSQGAPLTNGSIVRASVARASMSTPIRGKPAPMAHATPASLLAHILQEQSSELSNLSVGQAMRRIEEHYLIPQAASVSTDGLEVSRDPFSHQRGTFTSVELLVQMCSVFGPVVLHGRNRILQDLSHPQLSIESLPLQQVPSTPPMINADVEIRRSLQLVQRPDFWSTLVSQVVIPFLDLHCPAARFQVLNNMLFHSRYEAVQIFSVPSQFSRRLSEMNLQLVTHIPPRADPVLRLSIGKVR
jgi:hypothetical protein